MSYAAVSVTTVAKLIVEANTQRQEIIITNNSSTDMYIGMDSNVTSSNGLPLYSNQTREKSRGFGTYLGPIYGITLSGTCDVRFWETTQ